MSRRKTKKEIKKLEKKNILKNINKNENDNDNDNTNKNTNWTANWNNNNNKNDNKNDNKNNNKNDNKNNNTNSNYNYNKSESKSDAKADAKSTARSESKSDAKSTSKSEANVDVNVAVNLDLSDIPFSDNDQIDFKEYAFKNADFENLMAGAVGRDGDVTQIYTSGDHNMTMVGSMNGNHNSAFNINQVNEIYTQNNKLIKPEVENDSDFKVKISADAHAGHDFNLRVKDDFEIEADRGGSIGDVARVSGNNDAVNSVYSEVSAFNQTISQGFNQQFNVVDLVNVGGSNNAQIGDTNNNSNNTNNSFNTDIMDG